jgi:hypothetical protein
MTRAMNDQNVEIQEQIVGHRIVRKENDRWKHLIVPPNANPFKYVYDFFYMSTLYGNATVQTGPVEK